ncbi:hypothetical protein BH23GEM6_BH23GEM6_02910 [soil metagenome]
MDDGVTIQRVAQIAINAKSLQRAVRFYRDMLQLKLLFEIPSAAFFQCLELRLMIAMPKGERHDDPAPILYYRVTDIHRAFSRLSEKGVTRKGASPGRSNGWI